MSTSRRQRYQDAEREMSRKALERDSRSATVRELEDRLERAIQVIDLKNGEIERLREKLWRLGARDAIF